MLTNMKAYLLEGDETVRRELTTVLSFAGIGVAGGSEDADFALLGASSQGALPGIEPHTTARDAARELIVGSACSSAQPPAPALHGPPHEHWVTIDPFATGHHSYRLARK